MESAAWKGEDRPPLRGGCRPPNPAPFSGGSALAPLYHPGKPFPVWSSRWSQSEFLGVAIPMVRTRALELKFKLCLGPPPRGRLRVQFPSTLSFAARHQLRSANTAFLYYFVSFLLAHPASARLRPEASGDLGQSSGREHCLGLMNLQDGSSFCLVAGPEGSEGILGEFAMGSANLIVF